MKQKIQKETSCLDMSAESLVALRHPQVNKVTHEQIRWSNAIVNSPVMYGLIERRTLYFITGEVKHKFTEKNLGVPENWKDLYFHLTDEDLGLIGGQKNVPRTYEALSKLGEKFLPVSFRNEKGELIVGKVHWVDSFFYNTETGLYDVRVSPEIMPYLIDISRSFTTFDLGTAMLLRSKYSQKMYELCSQFCGDFRFFDRGEQAVGNVFKKRVVPIKMEDFRRIFNLDEIRDPRTKRVITPAIYTSFREVRSYILEATQMELYELYTANHSNLWFDFQEGPRKGRGGKVSSVFIFIYTKEFPKEGDGKPWQKGDEPLSPFEEYVEPTEHLTAYKRLKQNLWYNQSKDVQEQALEALLSHYLHDDEVKHYMRQICLKAGHSYDSYVQVIQVIQEKEHQPKFKNGTDVYRRKSIINYALKENLKEFGWSLEPMAKVQKTRKPTEQDLFNM